MAPAHRVYLVCPSFLRHLRRWSSRPIASNSSNRISTRAAAVVAMLVAMYIVGPFLLLRHRGRRVRCAQDARVQSAPVDNRLGPSRASGPPVKLITTRRSSCRLPTLDFQLQLSFGFQGSYFLITPSFFCPTYINLPPLADGSILHPWTPLVLIHTLFLAQNYYSASRHTRILQTRSRAFFFSVVITVVTINTSITFSQSVNQLVFFCIKSSCSCFFFSVLMTIRQSNPYTATFFTLQYGVLQFFFHSIHHFVPPFGHLHIPLPSESGMGMTVI